MEFDKYSTQAVPDYPPAKQFVGGLGDRLAQQECCRVGLMERVHKQAAHAQLEGIKASRLYELVGLLDENPVVARIMELMEEVRG